MEGFELVVVIELIVSFSQKCAKMREEVSSISIHSFYAHLYEKEILSTGAIGAKIADTG